MSISPYSLSHKWSLHWTRIPSNVSQSNYINGESPKERKALEALAVVGIIEGAQLFRLFSLDKKRLKRMVAEKKLVRHELIRNNHIIPIFTLGINGAVIGGLKGSYESNFWVEYKVEDVLKRLLFFQLFQHFVKSKILPVPEPFIGAIEFKDKTIYVYVVRGDVSDLPMYLKWKGKQFDGRLIVVTESIRHLQPLNLILENLKLRVAIDVDLKGGTKDHHKLFYFIDETGELKRDVDKPENPI